jgi:hypothetical protein
LSGIITVVVERWSKLKGITDADKVLHRWDKTGQDMSFEYLSGFFN